MAVLGILVLIQCRSERQLENFSNYLASSSPLLGFLIGGGQIMISVSQKGF